MKKHIDQIIFELKLKTNPARIKMLKTMIPTSMKVFGVSNPEMKIIA